MSYVFERSNFSLPDSQVKSPGFLLKDKKESVESLSKQKEIQELLLQFRVLERNSLQSFTDLPVIPNEKPTISNDKKSPLNWFVKWQSARDIRGPGSLKSRTEDLSGLIHKAKEVLQVFNIELIIHNSKNSKEVRNLLRTLVPEICFFPYSFYESLNIRNIIIAKECDDVVSSQNETCFFLSELDTKEKSLQRLHKIIFNHLMVVKGDLLKRWQENEAKHEDFSAISLEEVFMALMSNSYKISLKSQSTKLRECLEKFYPEAMSEVRFSLKGKQKKKGLKVHFGDSVTSNE